MLDPGFVAIRQRIMTLICEHSIDLPQAPSTVFAALDDFDRLPEWHAHCEGLAKQGHGPHAAGDKLRYAHCEGGRHRLMDGVIVTHEAPRRLTCRYFDKAMSVVVDFQLEPLDGGTRARHRIEITPQSLMARMTAAMIHAKADEQAREALRNLERLLARRVAA